VSGAPRVLGIDYGSRRIGVALSDPLGMFASPLQVIPNTGDTRAAAAVTELARARNAARVVVGLPRNMDGSEGPAAAAVRAFAARLTAAGLAIEFWDERLTTVQAERALIAAGERRADRKGLIDKIAAQQLLQSWLDRTAPPEPGFSDDEAEEDGNA
jgi:putative holliday junction resolvase